MNIAKVYLAFATLLLAPLNSYAQDVTESSSLSLPGVASSGTQDESGTDQESEDDSDSRYSKPQISPWAGKEKQLEAVEKTFGDPPGMLRLDPVNRVWIDKKKKRVVVDGFIAINMGQLEMFACIVGTKEHESVVAVFSKAFVIHAGLLAIGAKPGKPVAWEPEYSPPTGSEVAVYCLWMDKESGKRKSVNARKWVRQIGTDETELDTNFVFAGSKMWKDPDTGKERYQAESGDLVCVSNFTTATLDVPMKSSQVNSGLMFAAFEDRVPERGTPVRLVFQLVEENAAGGKSIKSAAKEDLSGTGKPQSLEKDLNTLGGTIR